MFDDFSATLNFTIFAGLALAIWLAGTRLSYFIDAIAEQTQIARAFLGLILLATATELPEMVTTLTAASQNNPTLALNNMFGGMMMQVAVLAIADIFVVHGTLTAAPRKPTPVIAGLFLMFSLSFLLMLHMTGDYLIAFHVGAGSICAAALYGLAMYTLQQAQHLKIWSAVDIPDQPSEGERVNRFDAFSMHKLIAGTVLCAAIILVCGVLLVNAADTLAEQTGLGTSFIGITLLSFTTSMPELSTSIAAVRVKAYTMAISNIFGSNLIMTFLILPVDIFYMEGSIINAIDKSAAFALAAGIMLTAIYCLGLLIRPKKKIMGMGVDSMAVLVTYLVSLSVLYQLR